jgi:hypothetical protein
MYRKFDVTGNLLFAQRFFFLTEHSRTVKWKPNKTTHTRSWKLHANATGG